MGQFPARKGDMLDAWSFAGMEVRCFSLSMIRESITRQLERQMEVLRAVGFWKGAMDDVKHEEIAQKLFLGVG